MSSANVSNLTSVTSVGGVTLSNNDRVLLKNQATATENGIYIYNASTTTLVKSTNAEDADIKEGSYTLATEGDHATQGWIVTAYAAGASTWTQFSAAGEYTAGNGIDITANAISVKLDPTFSGLAEDGSGLRVDKTKVVTKYATTITPVTPYSATEFTLTHNLGTTDIQVTVYEISSAMEVVTDVTYITTNTVTIGFAVAPGSGETYRVVVHA
jgi:hypothetical protein